jgi:hypothetical protein
MPELRKLVPAYISTADLPQAAPDNQGVVKLLKSLAKSQGWGWLASTVAAPLVVGPFRRRRPASPLIDQKCREQTHGVLSAKALMVLRDRQ